MGELVFLDNYRRKKYPELLKLEELISDSKKVKEIKESACIAFNDDPLFDDFKKDTEIKVKARRDLEKLARELGRGSRFELEKENVFLVYEQISYFVCDLNNYGGEEDGE